MGKKHTTMPDEPEEFPLEPKRLEIKQPNDPVDPKVPEEASENIPPELPPNEAANPE